MSSPSVVQMRKDLSSATKYAGSPKWRARVAQMPDSQIMAIWYRMSAAGEITRTKGGVHSDGEEQMCMHGII